MVKFVVIGFLFFVCFFLETEGRHAMAKAQEEDLGISPKSSKILTV